MLVKILSPSRFKFWPLVVIVLFFLAISSGFYVYDLKSNIYDLVSPLPRRPRPDLTDKLKTKLAPPLALDYSSATQLVSLSPTINYLVYQPRTGKVYLARNQLSPVSPASFTKLLTAQVALDVLPPDQLLTANDQAIAKEPTVLGLKSGEQLTLLELIRAAISTSANDAAAVIAEGVAVSYGQDLEFFIDLLNQKALILGLTNSHFANSEGYDDPAQYSTLEDLARLVANSNLYPEILSAGRTDRDDLRPTLTHGFYYLPNWNGLLGVYPGVTGLKIAYTDSARYSTIVTAARSNLPVVVILTGADSIRERDLATAALLDAAYLTENLQPVNLRRAQLDKRYKEWSDLATKIKTELGLLDKDP